MPKIHSLKCRRILNSHVEFTNEFIIELDDGSIGTGGSPQGETISIYEDSRTEIDPLMIMDEIKGDGFISRSVDQEEFDNYLDKKIPLFGRNNAYGLSLAFYNASPKDANGFDNVSSKTNEYVGPFICFNILNGGWHAYTNPVLSEFHEYILVSKISDLQESIACHNEIQQVVREKLAKLDKTIISGNPVNRFSTRDNRECLDFLLGIRDDLGYSEDFDLMIDASGGDLWENDEYHFSITDNSRMNNQDFLAYWLELIKQFDLGLLEDPFHERDLESWQGLTNSQSSCKVIGDNFYSSDSTRIEEGSKNKYTHGVIVKPNQAGTVTAVQKAIDVAHELDQIVITSHRSISTESTFLSKLTCLNSVGYIKIGPLFTDYSAVVRLNEIIRIAGRTL
jgi:enolase